MTDLMENTERPWNPLSIDEVAFVFSAATFPWWIAGGIALDLAVGFEMRPHADIDVLILRRDQLAARQLFSAWECWVADPPGKLRAWSSDEYLHPPAHDVWCRINAQDDWRIQLMLDEAGGSTWTSRRDHRIRAPLQEITHTTTSGVPYLAPHVQLFYKAKNPRPKDDSDFAAVLSSGIPLNTLWLRNAIAQTYGPEHPWLIRLAVTS